MTMENAPVIETVDVSEFKVHLMGKPDRPAVITIPADITQMEGYALINATIQVLATTFDAQATPRIQIARSMPSGD